MKVNGKNVLSIVKTITAANYDDLANKPIINADLDATSATTATQNQLYRHNGASATNYAIGMLYYTDGTSWVMYGKQLTAGDGISINNGVISGVAVKELWTNSNVSASMNTDTLVNLNSNDYDYLICIWTVSIYKGLNGLKTSIIPKGKNIYMQWVLAGGYYNAQNDCIVEYSRELTYVNDSQYKITATETHEWLSSSQMISRTGFTDFNIPYKILGVKL